MLLKDYIESKHYLGTTHLVNYVKALKELALNPDKNFADFDNISFNEWSGDFTINIDKSKKEGDFYYGVSKSLIRMLRYTDINDKNALKLGYDLFIASSSNEIDMINKLCEKCDIEHDNKIDDLNKMTNLNYKILFVHNMTNYNNLPIALLYNDKIDEYVVGYNYDKNTNSWGSGHYFNDFGGAMAKFTSYFNEKVDNMLNNKRYLRNGFFMEYVNDVLKGYDNDKLKNLSDDELKKLKDDIFYKVINDKQIWDTIDFSVYKAIDDVLEAKLLNINDIKNNLNFKDIDLLDDVFENQKEIKNEGR